MCTMLCSDCTTASLDEGNVDDIEQYIKLGKLGEAFTSDKQVVLLIDEIDKADLEFPNDLLWELDQDGILYSTKPKKRCKTKQQTDRDHHIQCRKGTAGCIPAQMYLSLHRIPGCREDGRDHQRTLRKYRSEALPEGSGSIL